MEVGGKETCCRDRAHLWCHPSPVSARPPAPPLLQPCLLFISWAAEPALFCEERCRGWLCSTSPSPHPSGAPQIGHPRQEEAGVQVQPCTLACQHRATDTMRCWATCACSISTSSLCPGAGASSQGIRENFPAAARAARPPLTQTAAREVPTILKHKERQQCCAKQEDLCMEPGCSRFPALPREREIGAGMGGTRFAQWCSDPGCCPHFAMWQRLFGADVGSSLLPGWGGSRGRAKCQSIALGHECG